MKSAQLILRSPVPHVKSYRRHAAGHARRERNVARAATSSSQSISAVTKVALITGANTGIGYETAAALGKKGYHVVLACRDEGKASNALARLRDSTPSGTFETRKLALDDLSSVKDFVKETLDLGRGIDVLVNNAGVMACPPMQTKDGFEYQFGVNHLGHFVLTTGLLPLMTDPDREGRIVTVSSSAHLFGRMQFDDINLTKNYTPWGAYGQSKLANVLFAFELARRLPRTANLTSNVLHPGVVDTELASCKKNMYSISGCAHRETRPAILRIDAYSRYLTPEASLFGNPIVKKLTSFFLKTPEQGAATSIYLASSPEVAGVTSKYYEDCRPRTAKHDAYDRDQQKMLWELSCEMAGVDADVEAAVKAPCKA